MKENIVLGGKERVKETVKGDEAAEWDING